MDGLLTALAAVGDRCVVQLTLTPASRTFDAYARHLFRARERAPGRRRTRNRADPGCGSELHRAGAARAGLERAAPAAVLRRHARRRPRRCAALPRDRGRAARRDRRRRTGSSSATCAHSGGAAPLYRARIARGVGNPLPGWRKGVLSSAELAVALAAAEPRAEDRAAAPLARSRACRRRREHQPRPRARAAARRAAAPSGIRPRGQDRRARADRRPEDRQDVGARAGPCRSTRATPTARSSC